jgi:Tol biopolymer transport system component
VRSRQLLLLSLLIAACSGDDQEPTNETTDVGFVRISAPTLGLGLDSNGYLVTLDPGTATAQTQGLPVNGHADFGGIPVGDHTFVIDDLSANCALNTDPTQPLTVLGGQIQPIAYPVTCTAPPLTGPNLITFQSDRDGFNEIYTMSPDGTHQTRVTQDELDNTAPSFAPDGQTIAFVQTLDGGPDEGGTSDIATVGADGSEETFLTETGLETDPSWSPDASRIAFLSDPDGLGGVAVMNADSIEDLRIIFRGTLAGRPAWAPDGSSLALESDGAIIRTDANGQNPTPIFTGDAHNPAWSPDLLHIAFDSPSQADGPGIFVIGTDGTGFTRITTGDDHAPTWSPDGSQIAFSRGAEDSEEQDIFVVNLDGSGLTQLTTDPAADSHPSWSH